MKEKWESEREFGGIKIAKADGEDSTGFVKQRRRKQESKQRETGNEVRRWASQPAAAKEEEATVVQECGWGRGEEVRAVPHWNIEAPPGKRRRGG